MSAARYHPLWAWPDAAIETAHNEAALAHRIAVGLLTLAFVPLILVVGIALGVLLAVAETVWWQAVQVRNWLQIVPDRAP